MLSDREHPIDDVWGAAYGDDPRCEGCGRSIVARFGGVAPAECDACDHEFDVLLKAGKLEWSDGTFEGVAA